MQNYILALKKGFELIKKDDLLTNRTIIEVQETLENNNAGFKKLPGTELIIKIKDLMLDFKHKLRDNYKFYSQDLLNNLFKHPYTKIEFLVNDLGVSRLTAGNYLNKLAEDKMLRKDKLGTGNYYINEDLFELLTRR